MAKLHTLVDNFNDNSTDTSLWTDTNVSETGGRAVVTPTGQRISVTTWDITASEAVVRVPAVATSSAAPRPQTVFRVELDTNNWVAIEANQDLIQVFTRISGTVLARNSATYSSTNHAFWRIRQASSTVYFETSANGVTWTQLQSLADPFTLTSVILHLGATISGSTSPTTASFETVNPVLLQDIEGNTAGSYTDQSVTNNTPVVHALTAAGTGTTTGTAVTLIQHVITASGTGTTTGSAVVLVQHIVTASGSGTSSGTAITLVTRLITASGTGTSTGSASLDVLGTLALTASGSGGSTGTASLILIGIHPLSAVGSGTFTGSASLIIVSTHSLSAAGTGTTTGTAFLVIPGPVIPLRDAAGVHAGSFTDEPVTNNTPVPPPVGLTAAGSGITSGTASIHKTLVLTAAGYTGRGIAYDDNLAYDGGVSYDPHPFGGEAIVNIVGAGQTPILTANGSGTFTGSATVIILAIGGISAGGQSTSTGTASIEIPIRFLAASSVSTFSGSADLRIDRFIYASGISFTSGSANLIRVGVQWRFEPPIVYDNPPFLPTTRGRTLMYARHRPSQPRGRSVLKNGSTYTVIDSPTVDQVNSATIAYLGGHVYTVDPDEAQALIAAGFNVVGVGVGA